MDGAEVTVKVSIGVGEDYPHLFVTDDPDSVRYAESPAAAALFHPEVAAEITDEQWAEYRQAADAYYEQVAKLDKLMNDNLARRPKP